MPETDTIPVSASVASTGKSLRYAGNNLVYAFSGIIGCSNVETTLLQFTTNGHSATVLKVFFNYALVGGDDFQYRIRFNDTVVQTFFVDSATGNNSPYYALTVVAPPLTEVKCTATNATGSATRNQICSISGRVYGAE